MLGGEQTFESQLVGTLLQSPVVMLGLPQLVESNWGGLRPPIVMLVGPQSKDKCNIVGGFSPPPILESLSNV